MSGLLEAIQKTQIPDIFAIQRVLGSEQDADELFRLADATKQREYGNTVFVRAIIEFSSYCRRECAYCGLNSNVPKSERYRMDPDEIVEAALDAAQYYNTVILQSGEDVWYTSQMLADIVRRIREKSSVALILAVGERSPAAYAAMRDAGANYFLIKHETADELLYEKYHGAKLKDRLAAQDELRKLGFEVGSGFLVGLPGQDDSVIAADILLLYQQDVDLADIETFIAHPDTIVAGYPDGNPEVTLRAIAVTRILLPKCHVPATATLNLKGGMRDALRCGADVVIQTATPAKYRALYDQYPGRSIADVPLKEQRDEINKTLRAMGLEPD